MQESDLSRNRPPSFPVRPITFIPFAFAVTAAYIMFSALPDVDIPNKTSPSLP